MAFGPSGGMYFRAEAALLASGGGPSLRRASMYVVSTVAPARWAGEATLLDDLCARDAACVVAVGPAAMSDPAF